MQTWAWTKLIFKGLDNHCWLTTPNLKDVIVANDQRLWSPISASMNSRQNKGQQHFNHCIRLLRLFIMATSEHPTMVWTVYLLIMTAFSSTMLPLPNMMGPPVAHTLH